jgi:hypothetical protein
VATLDVNGAVNAATSFNLGGTPFAYGSATNHNAFLGFAGNSTTTGGNNTAIGLSARASNTIGFGKTASGVNAPLQTKGRPQQRRRLLSAPLERHG